MDDSQGSTAAGITLISLSFAAWLISIGLWAVFALLAAVGAILTCGMGLYALPFVTFYVAAVQAVINGFAFAFAAVGIIPAYRSRYRGRMVAKGIACAVLNALLLSLSILSAWKLREYRQIPQPPRQNAPVNGPVMPRPM